MKSSKWITPIALATLASLTLAMNAHARGGGMGGGGMGGGQGYKQMGGQNQGQQQGETSRMRKRDPSQHEGQQETRAMNQERVRKQDGSGAMERRHDNPQSAASE